MKVTILIPCYNEKNTIEELVRRVVESPLSLEKEIIIVDDGSTDGSREILEQRVKNQVASVLFQASNQGKGAALSRGMREATGDVLVIQDADLEYNPNEYNNLLAPILSGEAQVVYGSRFLAGQPHRVLYFWHYLGNRFLTLVSNIFTNINLTDMECCYKVMTKEIYSKLDIRERRFGVEPEITAKIAKMKAVVYEVGISYSGRTYAQGKKIRWHDGFRALWCIVKYNLFSL